MGCKDANNQAVGSKLISNDIEAPLLFDGRKLYQSIRKHLSSELEILPIFEIAAPKPYKLKKDNFMHDRNKFENNFRIFSNRKREKILPLALPGNIKKILEAVTQLALSLELVNRKIPRFYFKYRFPFFKYPRLRYEFCVGIFYLDATLAHNDARANIYVGKDTNYCKVYIMKRDSHASHSLPYFSRKVGA